MSFYDSRGFINLDLDTINDPSTTLTAQDRRSWAVFFDGSYDLTDQLRFSAGVRYTRDGKDFSRGANAGGPCNQYTAAEDMVILDAAAAAAIPGANVGDCLDARSNALSRAGITAAQVSQRNLPFGQEAFGTRVNAHEAWTKWTWRAALDYQINDETMAYLTYSTGFLSGGFTETCSSVESCVPFDPETNYNVEGGLKADLFDNTLRANLAVFYGQYKDLQRNQVVPFTDAFGNTTQETITLNAGKSEVWGVELESTWVPVPELRVDLSVGYLDHEYIKFDVDLNGDGILDDGSHLDIPFSQHLQAGASATYDMDLDFGRISWNLNYHYQSEGEFATFNSGLTQLEARSLLGFRISYHDPGERYRITLWGRNMLDETYRTTANSVAGLWNFTSYGAPRAMGVDVGYSF
jgi:iron complex outermembrane receptor protein